MNASTGKILGIIVLVFLVLMVAGPLRFAISAPIRALGGVFDGFHWPHFDRGDAWAWPVIGLAGFFGLALLVFWIFVLIWVYRDAEKRGMEGIIWALVVFFLHLFGLIIYLLVRSGRPVLIRPASPPQPQAAPPIVPPVVPPWPLFCPKCGRPTDKDHSYCPGCGAKL
jgi:hypothetical protein